MGQMSAGTTYNRDYQAEASDAGQRPMATVFTRQDGTIRHFWSSELVLAPMEPGRLAYDGWDHRADPSGVSATCEFTRHRR